MISVIIPTYKRERVLLETIRHVLALDPPPDELIVVDQTLDHETETTESLRNWEEEGTIRWIRREKPSIPAAMNAGLIEASGGIVLFLDDDLIPVRDLLDCHRAAHERKRPAAVVGQVLQPGETPTRPDREGFKFSNDGPAWIADAMAGNLSVRREVAIAAGGFDENFRGAAYQFEKDFAQRLCRGEPRIYFEPRASIRHLRADSGGTRARGGHLTTHRPDHSVGAYYFVLVSRHGCARFAGIVERTWCSVATRHHFRRPWWIPVTLFAEVAGLVWALRLWFSGRKLLSGES